MKILDHCLIRVPLDPEFSKVGAWMNSAMGRNKDSSYVEKCLFIQSNSASDYATWIPEIEEAGDYDVYIYKLRDNAPDASVSATYEVFEDASTSTVYNKIDLTANPRSWQHLGTHTFQAGTVGRVILYGDGGPGKQVRADSIRFIKR